MPRWQVPSGKTHWCPRKATGLEVDADEQVPRELSRMFKVPAVVLEAGRGGLLVKQLRPRVQLHRAGLDAGA